MGIIYKNILSIEDYFVSNTNLEIFNPNLLNIPDYQRPYKWTKKNVIQLMNDIIHHSKKNNVNYRLGTIVLHNTKKDDNNNNYIKNKDKSKIDVFDIVDGQQRTITLAMIYHALININKIDVENKEITFLDNEFDNRISQSNIYNNYEVIKEYIREFDYEIVKFFLKKCELVIVILGDEAEAFQFFDSQNTRGKELYPHDLLKAFHLREISDDTNKIGIVETWEKHNSNSLNELLGTYLYRIKSWSMGKSAIKFTNDDIHFFKGISRQHHKYPYSELYRMADAFVDNSAGVSKYVGHKITYPFQIDSIIINGERFFEMIGYYLKKIKLIENLGNESEYIHTLKELGVFVNVDGNLRSPKTIATSNIKFLTEYDKKNRTGDKYIRDMFSCLLIYYIDKFGIEDVEKAINKYFIWAYSLRIEMSAVYIESINNYAIGDKLLKNNKFGINPFEIIRNSFTPSDSLEFENFKLKFSNETETNNAKLIEHLKGMYNNESK